MKSKFLFKTLAIIAIVLLVNISAKAQTNLIGKYYNREVISNPDGDMKTDRYLEIKKGNVATLKTKSQNQQNEQRKGSWNWDEKTQQLTTKFLAYKKDETEFTYVFKKTAKNIELIKVLTAEGEIYGKLWKKL